MCGRACAHWLPTATPQAQELTRLIYLRSQKIKPGQLWTEAPNLRPCEMLSFKETRAMDICRDNPGGAWVGHGWTLNVTSGWSFSPPAAFQICCN